MFSHIRHFSRNTWLYLVTPALIGFTVFGGIYTLLLNLYLLRLGYGPEFVGTVNAAGFLSLSLFSLPVGELGARIGLRRAMLLGVSLMGAGFGLLPLVELTPLAWRPAWLLITFVVGYCGLTLHIVNSQPYLMAATSAQERNTVFAVQAALWPLAGFLGSLVGGVLPDWLGTLLGLSLTDPAPYRYPLLLAALCLLPGLAAVWAIGEVDADPDRRNQEGGQGWGSAPILLVALMAGIGFLRAGGEGTGRTFFNVYLDAGLGVNTARIGGLLALAQLVSVPVTLAAPALADRWGRERLMIWGTVGLGLSLLPMALFPTVTVAGLSFLGILTLTSVTRPLFMVYLQEIVAPRWRGIMAGATTSTFGLSMFITALGGGYIIANWGYTALFLMGSGLSISGAILFGIYVAARSKNYQHMS